MKIFRMSETIRVPDGLYGVAVTETSISKSAVDGTLTYRGYHIKELFEKASLEECVFLILEGRLPKKDELAVFVAALRSRAQVPKNVYDIVRCLPADSHPMDVLRTAVSGLGATERSLPPKEQQWSLIAKMPALVANCYRILRGMEVVEPRKDLGQAANLLYMLGGKVPSTFDSWAFERELILYLEHDVNASTFTVRVVASTLADVYAASTAGLAALKGPLHGGANEAAMQMLLEVGTPENAGKYIQDGLLHGKKIMGFGHRVYKKVDPRAQLSKEMLKRLVQEKGGDNRMYMLAEEVEKAMWDAKKIPANLDFYAAPIFYTLGIPIPVYTPIFAASRISGWISHYNEQIAHNKLFRPDAVYVGFNDLTYVPIEKR
jgi:citrate synthase